MPPAAAPEAARVPGSPQASGSAAHRARRGSDPHPEARARLAVDGRAAAAPLHSSTAPTGPRLLHGEGDYGRHLVRLRAGDHGEGVRARRDRGLLRSWTGHVSAAPRLHAQDHEDQERGDPDPASAGLALPGGEHEAQSGYREQHEPHTSGRAATTRDLRGEQHLGRSGSGRDREGGRHGRIARDQRGR